MKTNPPPRRFRSKLTPLLLGVALSLAGWAAPSAQAQTNVYARLGDGTGPYAGELTQPAAYAGWSEIQSFSLGASNPGSASSGAGRVTFNPFSITRKIDRCSPTLFKILTLGAAIGSSAVPPASDVSLTLDYVRTGASFPFWKVEFKNVVVSGQNFAGTGGGGGGDIPMESLSFNYSAIKFTYTPTESTGAPGTPISYAWNFQTGTSSF